MLKLRHATLLSTTLALGLGLIVAPAQAAEVTSSESAQESELDCHVTLSAAEKSDIEKLATNYVTARAGFGKAIFPDLAKQLGVSTQTLWDLGNKDKSKKADREKARETVEKAAAAHGWTYDEVAELVSLGRQRDAAKYKEKYVGKYSEFNVDNDDWDEDYAKVMSYKNSITDLAARYAYFEVGDKPSKPFVAFVTKHDADFKAPFQASYDLKSVQLRAMSACISSYATKKPVTFTLDGPITKPKLTVVQKFTGEDNNAGSSHMPIILGVTGVLGVVAIILGAAMLRPEMFPAELQALVAQIPHI